MTPKIIHYCWFGPNPLPERELKCIDSWKKVLPDYELRFWTESNFDLDSNKFCKQAYEKGYFAFVSDYVRAKALYDFGGLYLDTDVELYKGFRAVVSESTNFLGFENKTMIGTAVMGFEPQHSVSRSLKSYYEENLFITAEGTLNKTANPFVLTNILIDQGLIQNNDFQHVKDIKIFPRDYFFPKLIGDDEFRETSNTVCVHKFSASWLTDREKKRGRSWYWLTFGRPTLKFLQKTLIRLMGDSRAKKIELFIRGKLK